MTATRRLLNCKTSISTLPSFFARLPPTDGYCYRATQYIMFMERNNLQIADQTMKWLNDVFFSFGGILNGTINEQVDQGGSSYYYKHLETK